MAPRTFKVSLRYPDGTVMFVGTVNAEEIVEIPTKEAPPSNGNPSADASERMTDPQKRYLFRLLAAQGVEGKKAEEHLRTYFRVLRLADVTRSAASTYIDHLVKDRKDAAS